MLKRFGSGSDFFEAPVHYDLGSLPQVNKMRPEMANKMSTRMIDLSLRSFPYLDPFWDSKKDREKIGFGSKGSGGRFRTIISLIPKNDECNKLHTYILIDISLVKQF